MESCSEIIGNSLFPAPFIQSQGHKLFPETSTIGTISSVQYCLFWKWIFFSVVKKYQLKMSVIGLIIGPISARTTARLTPSTHQALKQKEAYIKQHQAILMFLFWEIFHHSPRLFQKPLTSYWECRPSCGRAVIMICCANMTVDRMQSIP